MSVQINNQNFITGCFTINEIEEISFASNYCFLHI